MMAGAVVKGFSGDFIIVTSETVNQIFKKLIKTVRDRRCQKVK